MGWRRHRGGREKRRVVWRPGIEEGLSSSDPGRKQDSEAADCELREAEGSTALSLAEQRPGTVRKIQGWHSHERSQLARERKIVGSGSGHLVTAA